MLINKDWQKHNPINDILEPYENLIWIGRPNEDIYVRGNRRGRRLINVCVWSSLAGIAAITGLVFSPNRQQIFLCVCLLIAIPFWNYIFLASSNYQRADWYAFSGKRLFLTVWDHNEVEYVHYSTELSNLTEVFVKKLKRSSVPEMAETVGTLVCVYRRPIPKRLSNKFTFNLVDDPAEVQVLLLDAKAASVV